MDRCSSSRLPTLYSAVSFAVAGFLLATGSLYGQQAAKEAPVKDIKSAWDEVITETIPKVEVSPVFTQSQTPILKRPAGDFKDRFFFEMRTEYQRSDMEFTGSPTLTGVINAPFSGIFNPNGFPWDRSFQPSANRVYSYLNFGTRGWLSDRVNTKVGLRYRQDLTSVNVESPNANILGTYRGNRLIELMEGAIEINGRPTDGAWAGSTVEIGRINVYGAELASLDGASANFRRGRFSFGVFGGRRYSYFSDPDQRGIGGGSISFRPDSKTSLSYETLAYIRASHKVSVRRNLSDSLTFSSFFRAYGGSPVDFNAQMMFHPRNGKTSARFSFFQKLTNKDYSYDIYVTARDLDPNNRLLRLYLGQLQPYSQFTVDARRTFTPWFALTGAVAVQRLNDNKNDQSAFQTSFEDYRVGAQLVPVRKAVMDFEYHERDSDRLSPIPRVTFQDTRTSGETKVKDLSAQVHRDFFEGKLSLSGGAYYRRISIQSRFQPVEGAHQSGWLAGGWWKLNSRQRVFFDYALDNDFLIFRPSIAYARTLRVGAVWKY